MTLVTTGTLARRLNVSRERLVQILAHAGLQPLRDTSGRRLLTEQQAAEIERLRGKSLIRQRKD